MLLLKRCLALFGLGIALTKETSSTIFRGNARNVSLIDPVDVEYFTNLNKTSDSTLGRRGIGFVTSYADLTLNLFGLFVNSFSIKKLTDLSNLLLTTPPKFHNRAPGLPAAPVSEVVAGYPWAMISACPLIDGDVSLCVCEETFSEIHYVVEERIDAVVALAVHPKEKVIIVSYGPTKTFSNIMTDLDYDWADMPGSSNGAKVHKGFLNHFEATRFDTRMLMGKLLEDYPDYKLHITGFSLGSAVATISLPDWKQFLGVKNDSREIRAFLYSGPRVGNEDFVNHILDLNIQITRYTNRNDIVSHLLPRSYGFVHVGSEVHEIYPEFTLSTEPEYKVCELMYDEDPECGWKDRFPVSILAHVHPMNRYGPLPSYC